MKGQIRSLYLGEQEDSKLEELVAQTGVSRNKLLRSLVESVQVRRTDEGLRVYAGITIPVVQPEAL